MKILHISDNHGSFPELRDRDKVDVIVHSGDLMPNRTFGIRPVEHEFQRYWVETKLHRLVEWIGTDKPFLYVPGNHDYYDPTPMLRDAGVKAYLLCNSAIRLDGVNFWGHPWTPTFYDWNWMCGPLEMGHHLAEAPAKLMEMNLVDVLISHGPMYGVLDRNADGDRCGCKELRKLLQKTPHPPKALLHGHIHEAAGVMSWSRNILVSNAATTQVILDLCTDTSSS